MSRTAVRRPDADGDLRWPLMENNIERADLDEVVRFLGQADAPRLTQATQVLEFEREWSEWLGVRHSVLVNSGSSANLATIAALRHLRGPGEIIVPTLTWASDIASVLHCGFTPVFVDIDLRTLGMDSRQVVEAITPRTRAVFLTHILGYNALTDELLDGLARRGIPLAEDVCESHGARFRDRKLGTFGIVSNFSFYYAHHLSTVEGGMVSTDDPEIYEMVRMLRSHGMVRESTSEHVRRAYAERHPDLNPEFIFAYPAWNFRSTEINAVIGRSQLRRLDANNVARSRNLRVFLEALDPERFLTDFELAGSCNYALTLILRWPDPVLRDHVVRALREHGVEFRRGTSGGGNQLRQPYLRGIADVDLARFPRVEHVHFFGFYIGNYPGLAEEKIVALARILNDLPTGPPAGPCPA